MLLTILTEPSSTDVSTFTLGVIMTIDQVRFTTLFPTPLLPLTDSGSTVLLLDVQCETHIGAEPTTTILALAKPDPDVVLVG